MMKPASVSVAIALALVPQLAHAELPVTIGFSELKIHRNGGAYDFPIDDFELREYLNHAHCLCDKRDAGMENGIQYLLTSTGDTGTSRPAELWVGTSCEVDKETRDNNCRKVGDVADIDQIDNSETRIEVSLFDAIAGKDTTASCAGVEGNRSLYFFVDTMGAGDFDHHQTIEVGTTETVTRIDTKPPPLPTDFELASAEEAIRITWDPPATDTDIYGYQILCAKQDGTPGREGPDARYTRVADLCGLDAENIESFEVKSETVKSSDTTPAMIPDAMMALDPSFICGEVIDQTAREALIEGLDNGEAYSVIVVAVDEYGNAVGAAFDKTATPKPAFDFWEDLHNRGSNVEGGFCLAGTQSPGGTAGPLALALGWLLVRRRRNTRTFARLAPIAGLALVMFGGTRVASAQVPYWEEQQDEEAALADQDLVKWHVGLRFGPYTPDIDKQFGMDPGPYSEMFGGYQVLPMLDIDRIVWRGVGQLGFGGSIGYMQKTANAWADPVPGEDRMRSAGDENTFRLWPLVATAVYRFTWLDDNYGIPVIPYVRGGISYYIWWMSTNGKTSEACWDGTNTPDCDADKAYGATIGVQGSIGLAIRAERVDAAAASAMRQGGIQHAGFYGELQMGKVDGFGSEFKLSVGDTTWFAGVNFEF
jgi:hypothetical protein